MEHEMEKKWNLISIHRNYVNHAESQADSYKRDVARRITIIM